MDVKNALKIFKERKLYVIFAKYHFNMMRNQENVLVVHFKSF